MNTKEAEETLHDLLMNGIAKELFFADHTKALAATIGKHSRVINSKGFGDLFGSLQSILSDHQTLAVAKIYDPPSKKYPTRSIPAMLSLIEKHSSLWSLPQRHVLERLIIDEGHNSAIVQGMDSQQLSLAVVSHFNRTMPHKDKAGHCRLSSALEAVREARNKVHAHNEAVDKASRKLPTWGDVESLVDYAKDFACVVGFGFLSLY
ncbi:MAG: hypothetical protein M3261_06535, partial [Thermoproteota archaeon]|nr:hypothetical protein [Thermoproteota archaeon]